MSHALRRRPSMIRILLLSSLLLIITGLGCAGTPKGPTFRWAAPPAPQRGRVYLYRLDARGSLAVVRTTIDGDDVRIFRDREYETFEITPGSHRIRATMQGFGLFALGWNEHAFRIEPGETLFLHLDVRIDHTGGPELGGPRELEVAGRSNDRVSENIFIGEKTREKAAEDLEITTRLVRSN